MSERRTRSGGAAQRSGPRAPSPPSLRRSQRKSGSDLPSTLPEIWPKAPHVAPVRKPIVLKKIVAHTVKIPSVHSPRRSPRIAFFLEKENNPPSREPTREDLFKTCSVPATPTSTPVPCSPNVESNSGEDLDTRDLEMSKKVRRSYSRLETLSCASTSTPGRRSCFGFEGLLGAEDLAGVSPLSCSKLPEVPRAPANPWAPDTTLPGISPPVVKEKRKKKKAPEILSPRGRRRPHSEPSKKPMVPPIEGQKLEDPQVSGEPGTEPPSSEPKLDLQPEPTFKFLFTLLSVEESSKPKDPEEDLEIQESRFLDEEDWGAQQTSKEIRHLQNACMRLQESLSTSQADNLALGEKLQNLPNSLYNRLKEEVKAMQEEVKAMQEEVKDIQEEVKDIQE